MTLRRFAAVWGAAALMAALPLGALGFWAAGAPGLALPDVPVVAIGSSLLRYGLPPHGAGGPDALLGDGRAHVRLAKNSMNEEEALGCLAAALRGGTEAVRLEINPFAVDLADGPQRLIVAGSAGEVPAAALLKACRGLAEGLEARHRAPIADLVQEANFERGRKVSPRDLASLYPLTLREPRRRTELTAMLARARAEGVRVVLVAPPRSRAAVRYLGGEATEALRRHLEGLAAELGEPLFMPGPAWDDRYFIDNAHMNPAGRERFIRELRIWWKARA
jgi:hypothetical protein